MSKLLFISHSLDYSGAPLVLTDMIKICKADGFIVDLISMDDGPLRMELESEGINITIADVFLEDLKRWQQYFKQYTAVIVNTLICIEAIYALNTTNVPTLWWIHEHEPWFIHYKPIFPKPSELNSNIHVYGVSPITCSYISQYCGYKSNALPFGVKDSYDKNVCKPNFNNVSFVFPGKISSVKGQNLLLDALNIVPQDILSKCSFTIFGRKLEDESDYYNTLISNSKKFNNIVQIEREKNRYETLSQVAKSDYILIPSIIEPFSATAVEAMMFGVVPIISDICGVTFYLENNLNSYIFASENVSLLAETIEKAVNQYLYDHSSYEKMSSNARKCYESTFSFDCFKRNIMTILNKIT